MDINNSRTNDFRDLFMDNLFFPLISKPTRITKKSQTCIDHIWSNIYNHNFDTGIIFETVSDHLAPFIFTDIHLNKLSNRKGNFSDTDLGIKKIDYDSFINVLSDVNTEHILSSNNLNEAYENFEDIIVECVDKSSVVRRRKPKNYNKNI